MKLSFLHSCTTIDQLKQTYKTLAKQHHPDKGGNLEDMQQLNAEYDFVHARLLKGMGLSDEETNKEFDLGQTYKDKIQALIIIDGILIEVAGTWIWVTGDTRNAKEILKENGFFWAKNKLAWFWRPEGQKSANRNPLSLAEIRNKYGSTIINPSSRTSIQA